MKKLGVALGIMLASSVLGCSRRSISTAHDGSTDAQADLDSASDHTGGDEGVDTAGGEGGAGGGSSCAGPIAIRLDAVEPDAWFAVDSGDDCGDWLSIHDSSGNEVAIGHPAHHCCRLIGCTVCHFEVLCPAAFSDLDLPITRSWDATLYAPGVCGSASTACVQETRNCAPAGSYVAHMCAKSKSSSNGPWTCVDAPFTIPGTHLVIGTLPSVQDAGADATPDQPDSSR